MQSRTLLRTVSSLSALTVALAITAAARHRISAFGFPSVFGVRLSDLPALLLALAASARVYCAFVFDREILDGLARADRRGTSVFRGIA